MSNTRIDLAASVALGQQKLKRLSSNDSMSSLKLSRKQSQRSIDILYDRLDSLMDLPIQSQNRSRSNSQNSQMGENEGPYGPPSTIDRKDRSRESTNLLNFSVTSLGSFQLADIPDFPDPNQENIPSNIEP